MFYEAYIKYTDTDLELDAFLVFAFTGTKSEAAAVARKLADKERKVEKIYIRKADKEDKYFYNTVYTKNGQYRNQQKKSAH